MNINDALMGRGKLAPMKRKRATPTKKVPSTGSSSKVQSIAQFPVASRKLGRTGVTKMKSGQGDDNSSTSSPARRTTGSRLAAYLSPVIAKPATQAYIDLGQKDFGRHITCQTCGLLYTAGEEQDEREHQRFCKQRQKGITLAKTKHERLVKAFPDDKARIIDVRPDDTSPLLKRLQDVKELLDDALGFVEQDVFMQRSHYLYLSGNQIVGAVTAEGIKHAFPVDRETPSIVVSNDASGNRGQHDNLAAHTHSDTRTTAMMGICQIWVHPDFRSRRIATRLVDALCDNFVYGLHIPRHKVAFAQPTQNGLAFATKYVAPHTVLAYDGV